MRYVVTTPPSAGGDLPLGADEDVRVVAALDRGLLVDERRAAALAEQGLRVRPVPDPHTLELFGHRIDTEHDRTPDLPEELRLDGAVARVLVPAAEDGGPPPGGGTADVNHLVQLVGPVQESWLTTLTARGVRVVEAVGRYGFLVRADAATVARLRALPFVAWTGRLEPGYKVNPVLLGTQSSPPGLGPVEAVDVGVLADGDVDGVVRVVTGLGSTVQEVSPPSADTFRSITAQLGPQAVAAVAALADVRWVDAVRAPVLEDERTALIVHEALDDVPRPSRATRRTSPTWASTAPA